MLKAFLGGTNIFTLTKFSERANELISRLDKQRELTYSCFQDKTNTLFQLQLAVIK